MIRIPFYLIDSIRTNNFNDPNMLERIQNLWSQSLNKLAGYSGNIFAIYHKYVSDYKGDYTLSIATDSLYFKESSGPIISKEAYAIFKVKDNLRENIVGQWQSIWKLGDEKKFIVPIG